MTRKKNHEIGTGNVFADLGLDDADELFTRAQIDYYVYKILQAKELKQREIAAVLSIAQSDVSHLMNGHFSRFTTNKLLGFLKRLDRKVDRAPQGGRTLSAGFAHAVKIRLPRRFAA
jgi:predicted XRE-type DNA-binding protein